MRRGRHAAEAFESSQGQNSSNSTLVCPCRPAVVSWSPPLELGGCCLGLLRLPPALMAAAEAEDEFYLRY